MAQSLEALRPDVQLAHCVWLEPGEIELIAGSRIGDRPLSHLEHVLGFGGWPVRKMLDAGIPVTMGTDSRGIWQLARYPAHAQVGRASGQALRQRSEHTAPGAGRAHGGDDRRGAVSPGDLGQIAAGAVADLTLIRLDTLHAVPTPDPATALAYSSSILTSIR